MEEAQATATALSDTQKEQQAMNRPVSNTITRLAAGVTSALAECEYASQRLLHVQPSPKQTARRSR
jgi:hypothetical protein